MPDRDDLIRQEGNTGRITLNRPSSLNAITHGMIRAIYNALVEWQRDDSVRLVVIDAAGDRAFCAGGDLGELYRSGMDRDFAYGRSFWQDEYVLNNLIANYAKPYVAVMDRLILGGGVGLTAHGSLRLVTERTGIAMPECNVGLVPDVGVTAILGRAPGFLGEFIGLTGYRMDAADAIYAGFADVLVNSDNLPDLIGSIVADGDVSSVKKFARKAPSFFLKDRQKSIDEIFGGDSLNDIMATLAGCDADWLVDAFDRVRSASPLSLLAAFGLIRLARENPGIREALRREYRFTASAMEHGDFLEGIRAAVIDKDKSPNWKYRTVEEVPASLIARMQEKPVSGELEL